MSGFQQVCTSQLFPFERLHVQHFAEFFAAERQEGFEGDGQVGYQLKCDVQDGCYASHVCLGQFPRFGVSKVFVSDTCQVHGFFLCIAELEYVQKFFHLSLYICKFFQCFLVVVCQFTAGRHFAVKIFVGQYQGTIHKVTVNGYQFIVVACLEIFPCKVVVFGFRSVGSQYVTQYVLFAGEILQVFMQPYSPVA